jgi:hypothetical protein
MKYQPTLTIHSPLQLNDMHIGQWFKFGSTGQRGQYMGTTRAGSDVVVYQNKFSKANAKRVGLMRDYAKRYGAK